MGYQALLFCPDDKTARTVTQVLSELEFTVDACIEPFAAVKKLMGQHFDAVVVDCDNEQNATLLFKSARNSTSNQTSLAVAVVEGQAGVAKAFRIGANLVLTKPINIEQAKGTLRVARGLLRKSDPTKPGSATATGSFAVPTPPPAAPPPPPAPPKSAALSRPPLGGKPAAPVASKPVVPTATAAPRPQPPVQKPVAPAPPAAWPAAAAASAKPAPVSDSDIPVAPAAEKPPAPVAPPALYSAAVATPAVPRVAPPAPPTIEFKPPVLSTSSAPIGSGAASAPAPAREPAPPKIEQKPAHDAEDLFEKQAAPVASEPAAYVGSAPSFTFGGSTTETESSGGSKKAMIGIAAALLIVAGGYFGWSHFKGTSSSTPQPVATSAPVSAPVSTPAAPKPTAAQPPPATATATTPAPGSQPDKTLRSSNSSEDENEVRIGSSASPAVTKPVSTSSAPPKSVVADKSDVERTEAPALIVKGGKAPAAGTKQAPMPDAPAPSVIGMGASAAAPLPNLGTTDTGIKPMLQTLSVSQGVSQGLLYKKVAPSYPPNALRMHIEGTVELLATISKEGNISHIKVLSGEAQLARSASDAVKQWKYKPYLLNGEPVEIQTQVTVNFKLPR
ncbi:MAG TPA: TonB family protein [Candidatus Sulfotelmatobacter sp.]|nr:TonB family protein [Candidatus Sulfotelmatobacter sp.]